MTRQFLTGLFLASWIGAVAVEAAPPNIVFIMADDLGWADVGFHGGVTPTPHLDQLASSSVELTQHYVAPVCTPTRVGLLTGRYWSRFGVTTPKNERSLPFETVTMASALRSAGYETCLTGKWHLGSKPAWGPNHFGFDHSYGSLAGGVSSYGHYYKKGPFSETWHRNEELIKEEGHVTDLLTQEAISWLEGRSKPNGQSRPFFLYVPFTAVHLPVNEPDEWLAKVPASIRGEVPRHYSACIMHLDDSVGKILQSLEDLQLSQNTLVVFTSDNGGSTAENNDTRYPHGVYPQGKLPGDNRPLRGRKGDLYEGGIRVPTLVRWKGTSKDAADILPSGKVDTPIHITDWMPTFCKLAGYQGGKKLNWDGQDVLPALRGESLEDRTLFWAGTSFRSLAVRQGKWKWIGTTGDNARSTLYDLERDPGESTDLAGRMPEKTKMMQGIAAELRRQDVHVKAQ